MGGKPDPHETKQQARKQVRTVEAVGESEEWLFTTLESVGDAIIATDVNGIIVFMNRVAVALTGWSEEDAQGRDCREVFRIVNEQTRRETESPVNRVIRDGVISGLANHTILIARDGVEHHIDDSGSPIRSKEGQLTGVVLIFRDITEHRKIELTVQEQQEILQTLFQHIPVIVTFLNADERFKWVNREFTRVTGWSLDEMRDPQQSRLFFPRPLQDDDALTLAREAPLGWHDLKLSVKDGRVLDIAWSTVRLSDGTIIGIGQDITHRKSLEEEKAQLLARTEAQNLRLEQAMEETDHRVKNNLQVIGALLDLQVMTHEETVPVKELSQVRMHITTLASIHDMLVQDVKGGGLARSLSAKAQLLKLLPMLQQVVGGKRIEWSVDDVQLPIKQGMSLAILVNELVNNAVKHGGREVQLRLDVSETRVTLEVCDDGPGFSEAFHPHSAANFGLELVESVGRVDLGGQTTYENRPEGGARVRVTFPIPLSIGS